MVVVLDGRIGCEEYKSVYGSLNALRRIALGNSLRSTLHLTLMRDRALAELTAVLSAPSSQPAVCCAAQRDEERAENKSALHSIRQPTDIRRTGVPDSHQVSRGAVGAEPQRGSEELCDGDCRNGTYAVDEESSQPGCCFRCRLLTSGTG